MVGRFFGDLKKYRKYIAHASRAELKSEVASSYLNWLWWILEPVCLMLIYNFIFGYVFKAREAYFPAFIYLGITLWDYFARNVKASVKLIKNNKAIVSKVYIPKFVLLMQKMMVNAFKSGISLLLVAVLMVAYRIPITWSALLIVPILLLVFVYTFAVCLFTMHFGVYIEDLANVVNIALRLGFYLSGIMFKITTRIPGIYGVLLSRVNPLACFIIAARGVLLERAVPDLALLGIWLAISALLLVLGLRLVYRSENSYVKAI